MEHVIRVSLEDGSREEIALQHILATGQESLLINLAIQTALNGEAPSPPKPVDSLEVKQVVVDNSVMEIGLKYAEIMERMSNRTIDLADKALDTAVELAKRGRELKDSPVVERSETTPQPTQQPEVEGVEEVEQELEIDEEFIFPDLPELVESDYELPDELPPLDDMDEFADFFTGGTLDEGNKSMASGFSFEDVVNKNRMMTGE